MKKIFLLLILFCVAFSQYYDIAIVRANDSTVLSSLLYDDNSTSYADNSIENPDANIRICASNASDLLDKYVSLCYADGFDGDYLELTTFPVRITSVEPNGCTFVPLDISSFKAWYPAIPYVFISNSTDLSSASRWKLSRLTGWFAGNYSINRTQSLNMVTINVTNATDDNGAEIVPDVNYLVIGLVRSDFTTMDTAIASPRDNVTLLADSPTSNYSVFINGIGPDVPPYVSIITPEDGKEYSTSTIPFTYVMIDDDGVSNCWYVLDGARTDMPNCGPAYILSGLRDGSHTLVLYANDTTGNVAYDSVQFTVKTTTPTPGGGGGGGGGTGIPYKPPIVPPKPPFMELTILPQNIFVILNYDQDGTASFSLLSTIALTDVSCYVRGDFENYTTVSLEKTTLQPNESVKGEIVVSMPPVDILEYDKGKSGVLQCVGNASTNLLASTLANVYLSIRKPKIELGENATLTLYQGEKMEYAIKIVNKENKTEIKNLSLKIEKYDFLFSKYELSQAIPAGQDGLLSLSIAIPDGMEPGTYEVPITFYEHGKVVGFGTIKIIVLKKEIPPYKPPECHYPDLSWTILILVIGFIVSLVVFKLTQKEKLEGQKMAGGMLENMRAWFEINKKPLLYAVAVMIISIVIWIFVVLSNWKCT